MRRAAHRRLATVAIVAFVLAVVLLWGWLIWLPSYRPTLGAGERYGIDVSHHQGDVGLELVAGDDITFAYIKATQRDDFVDPRFADNWAAARAAGIERGAYHFFSLCATGEAQAAHFLSVMPNDPEMLPPAVDLELVGSAMPDPTWPSSRARSTTSSGWSSRPRDIGS